MTRTLLVAGLLFPAAAFADEPAPAAAEAPLAEPALTPAPKPEAPVVVEAPAPTGTKLRAMSYAVLGMSIVAAGVGVYFGATSAGARAQIVADLGAGTFSQQQLYQRDQAAITQAKLANGLFISAAIVGAIGVLMFVLGG